MAKMDVALWRIGSHVQSLCDMKVGSNLDTYKASGEIVVPQSLNLVFAMQRWRDNPKTSKKS